MSDFNIRPGALGRVGDLIFVNQAPHVVTVVNTYAPGTPEAEASPMASGLVVREVITPEGARYFAHAPGGRYRGVEILGLHPDGVSFEGGADDGFPNTTCG